MSRGAFALALALVVAGCGSSSRSYVYERPGEMLAIRCRLPDADPKRGRIGSFVCVG